MHIIFSFIVHIYIHQKAANRYPNSMTINSFGNLEEMHKLVKDIIFSSSHKTKIKVDEIKEIKVAALFVIVQT